MDLIDVDRCESLWIDVYLTFLFSRALPLDWQNFRPLFFVKRDGLVWFADFFSTANAQTNSPTLIENAWYQFTIRIKQFKGECTSEYRDVVEMKKRMKNVCAKKSHEGKNSTSLTSAILLLILTLHIS
jgi:hypothetical protein